MAKVREHLVRRARGERRRRSATTTRFREDLDADSLDLYELVMELEDTYGICGLRGGGGADRDGRRRGGLRRRAAPGAARARWRAGSAGSGGRAGERAVAGRSRCARSSTRCPPSCASALTHSSWVENRADSYGRLAFLGDSVLGLALAETSSAAIPRADIGRLTKMHGQAVSGRACAEVAVQLGVPELLARGRPARARGRDRARLAALLRARARLGLRGGDRRLLPPPRVRDHRGGDGRGVRDRARDRVRAAPRLQVGAPGARWPATGPA